MISHPSPPEAHEREPTHEKSKRASVSLDLEKYMGQLDDWDITEDQKAEFIRTFWELLLSFAQIGFEVHPAQQALAIGRKPKQQDHGKQAKSVEKTTLLPPHVLHSNSIQRTHIKEEFAACSYATSRDSSPEGDCA